MISFGQSRHYGRSSPSLFSLTPRHLSHPFNMFASFSLGATSAWCSQTTSKFFLSTYSPPFVPLVIVIGGLRHDCISPKFFLSRSSVAPFAATFTFTSTVLTPPPIAPFTFPLFFFLPFLASLDPSPPLLSYVFGSITDISLVTIPLSFFLSPISLTQHTRFFFFPVLIHVSISIKRNALYFWSFCLRSVYPYTNIIANRCTTSSSFLNF